MPTHLFTIGFTEKSAREFFSLLRNTGVKRVVVVRLNNNSQLAGFSKKNDLAYFLKEIGGMDYTHLPDLAPTQEMLDGYKKGKGGWEAYARQFLDLMAERKIEETISPALREGDCLLCSEHLPHHCHRRLVAEYLQSRGKKLQITHLF